MEKSSNIGPWLGRLQRNFGSISGEAAPALFRHTGGPVTGSLVQGAMLALPAYAARRATGWLRDDDPEYSRRAARRMALLGGLAGFGLNVPQFFQNITDPSKGINWNAGRIETDGS